MDYSSRIKSIQGYLKESKLDAFLVLTKVNRQYLSGFTGSAGVLVIASKAKQSHGIATGLRPRDDAVLYVDERYLIRARKESDLPVKSIKKLTMTPLTSPLMRGERGGSRPHEGEVGRGSQRIAVEDRITLREFGKLKKQYPRVQWKITHNLIENLRAVKTPEEIRNIKKGSQIIDEIFRQIIPPLKIRGGKGELSEIDIALLIERLAKKLGAQALAFDPIVAFGSNAAAPHHFSSNKKIGRNNFLLLDFGVIVNGYHSDFTRTLFIGKPNKKQEKVYNVVLEAQSRAIKKIRVTPLTSPLTRGERGGSGEKKEGVKASVIDKTARDYIALHGYAKYFTHNTGHGVGLEIHEQPNFSPDSEDILQKNMIVTVEPGIYIERWGGVRIEDMVIVGKKPEVLSKIPKEFNAMIIK